MLITVNQNETAAVLEAFRAATGQAAKPLPIEGRVYRELGSLGGTPVFHTLSEMGSGSIGASHQTTEKAIRAIKPTIVIAVGIAFGIDQKKQAIGQILVSRQLLLYELQRVGESRIEPRGDKPHASARLVNLFEGAAQITWQGSRVSFGTLLTGEKLVDNVDFRGALAKFDPSVIGGEMEGAGIYVACQENKVDWIVIKAICDWADGQKGKNKEARQRKAAGSAASFVAQGLAAVFHPSAGSLPQVVRNSNPRSRTQNASSASREEDVVATSKLMPRASHLSIVTSGLGESNTDVATLTLTTDEPVTLAKSVEEIRSQLRSNVLHDRPVLPSDARLSSFLSSTGTRSRLLHWLATTPFSAHLYFSSRAALDRAGWTESRLQAEFITLPIVHRLSDKAIRVEQIASNLAEITSYVDAVISEIKTNFHRTLSRPATRNQTRNESKSLLELAELVLACCQLYLANPIDEEARAILAHVRTRLKYAVNVAVGERHTRDKNPLP